jgi:hypothetical protein
VNQPENGLASVSRTYKACRDVRGGFTKGGLLAGAGEAGNYGFGKLELREGMQIFHGTCRKEKEKEKNGG